jgi:hypothetical protein
MDANSFFVRSFLADIDRIAENPAPARAEILDVSFNPVHPGSICDVGANIFIVPCLDRLAILN